MNKLRSNQVQWIINRLHEPSSWRGLIWLATAVGISISPEVAAQVVTVGMSVAGLIGLLSKN
jgi:hypothetical protein